MPNRQEQFAPKAARNKRSASPAPGQPGFVERRQQFNRRATDFPHGATIDGDVLARRLEEEAAKALHRVVPRVVSQVVGGAYNDANLQGQPTSARVDTPIKAGPGPKAVKATTKEEVVVRNGVRCPEHGSVKGDLWLMFADAGAGVTLSQARELAKQAGKSPSTAAIALYEWRKFHNVPNPV